MALMGTIKWYISMPDDWLWEFVYINLDPNIVRRIFDDSRRHDILSSYILTFLPTICTTLLDPAKSFYGIQLTVFITI